MWRPLGAGGGVPITLISLTGTGGEVERRKLWGLLASDLSGLGRHNLSSDPDRTFSLTSCKRPGVRVAAGVLPEGE
jgi:hypothetical protein